MDYLRIYSKPLLFLVSVLGFWSLFAFVLVTLSPLMIALFLCATAVLSYYGYRSETKRSRARQPLPETVVTPEPTATVPDSESAAFIEARLEHERAIIVSITGPSSPDRPKDAGF